MKRAIISVCVMFFLGLPLSAADEIPLAVARAVYEGVMEVVVPKPTTDSLVYEKPLPLDLLPYSVRMDQYYPIGSAFLVSRNTFMTAAHVLPLHVSTQFAAPVLRDAQKNIYVIDRVLGYANDRDYVIFTVVTSRDIQSPFKIAKKAVLNEKVYAVGNALGEGTVIREGLLTSETPEDMNGEWKWLRFSAAASPGNSGGPLLDKDGRVLGVVVMKSENENLNYALPLMTDMRVLQGSARYRSKTQYFLANINNNRGAVIPHDKSISLPKTYAALKQELTAYVQGAAEKDLAILLTENVSTLFPNGQGARPRLYTPQVLHTFPYMLAENAQGEWSQYAPEEIKTVNLEENGYVQNGSIAKQLFVRIRVPDSTAPSTFYADPVRFMDTVLKGVDLYRRVGNKPIRVVSSGKPSTDTTYTDRHGRIWLVRVWDWEYCDEQMITFTLPVPDGTVTIVNLLPTSFAASEVVNDFKFYVDHVSVSYIGSPKQWQDFLQTPYVPEHMKQVAVDTKKDAVNVSLPEIRVSFTDKVVAINEKNYLSLTYAAFPMEQGVSWAPVLVQFGEDRNKDNDVLIKRVPRPASGLSDAFYDHWDRVSKLQAPYDGSLSREGKGALVTSVIAVQKKLPEKERTELPCIYAVGVMAEGNVSADQLKGKLEALQNNVSITE